MGNFRPRVKGKGKRWAKGQSASSNPETRKFRDSAKSRFFHENLGQTGLTTEALQKHDAFSGVPGQEEAQYDALTVSESTFKTFGTFASDWSSCSNQSFNRLLNGFRPDSAIHKEMLAVLAAVTEVLKMKGGREDESEYFMALMTTLEATDSVDSVTAILALISMSIKKVPDAILRVKFSETTKTLVNLLGVYAETDNNVILRSVIGCLSVLLRAQEASSWVNSSTLQVYDSILTFTIHVKPKVRKAAKHAICAILKGSCFMLPDLPKLEETKINPKKIHPAAGHTAKFCIHEMERVSSLGSGSTSTLHMLGLLKEILPCFPKSQLKAACECILKVMTLGNVLVSSCGMQALHGLFVSRPPPSTLPPDLNARLIAALFQYQPPLNDTQPLMAWLVVMQEAYCNLARQDLNLCMGNIPRLFSTCTQLWLSDRQEILSAATGAMHTVAKDCISLANTAILEDQEKHSSYILYIQKAVSFVGSGLKYQYHSAWKHVFLLLSTMFEVCNVEPCQKCLVPLLSPLADLRDSDKFTYTREVDNAIGKAITSFGPKIVLTAIPFTITGQEKSYDFPRSWILPVLKESVKNSEIKIFMDMFLPLAAICRNKSQELAANSEKVGSHTYDLLQAQIWALLPSFCSGATDVKENFKNIAKILGMAISDRKDLRLDVMLALRRLTTKSLESEEERKEISRFAKNFLPILFNLYTTQPNGSEEAGHRLAAYETIKLYLKITDPVLCTELFDRAFAKLQTFKPGLSVKKKKKKRKGKKGKEVGEAMQEDMSASDKKDVFVRESVMDLLRALLPWQSDGSRLRSLYDYCVPLLSSKDAHEQKKAYRVIEEICGCGSGVGGVSSNACKEFFNSNVTELQNVLLQSLSTAAPSSKAPRIRCLIHLVKMLEANKMDAIQAIVPEAVLCIKDINEKCRTAAFNLLVEIGKTLQRWSSKPIEEVLRDYVAIVMAGLAGSPVLISSTILALGRVVYEFKGLFPKDLLKIILENVCLLMVTTSREVVNSALSFAKVLVQSYSANDLAPFVPTLVKSLSCMVDDTKRHFRLPVRHLFERLVRRYGYDAVARVVPESDAVTHKRLNNIRKIQARKKRQHNGAEEEEDDESTMEDFKMKAKPMSIEEILAESDSDDEFFGEEKKQKKDLGKKGKKQKKQSTWIQEGGDDSIVDFTDTAVAKRISTSKPGVGQAVPQQVKKEKKEPFKTAPDGRLIITDDGGTEDMDDDAAMGRKAKRKRKVEDSESDMDDDDDEGSVMAPILGKRKHGGSVSTEGRSYRPPMKYQAGGSGIHRPLGSQGKAKPKQMTKKESMGQDYRSNKAGGDVKKKGKPDPYAYIPLSRKSLNKRKRAKSTGQFKNIIHAAKKGAIQGAKAKARLARR